MTAQDLVVRRGRFTLAVPSLCADSSGTALLGPNGAGKTTLLLALHGLIAASGTIIRPARTASVFARPAVLRGSAQWNVATLCEAVLRTSRTDAARRAREVLSAVGLDALAGADARTLSTGERQRLALARALVLEPEALLLDEPFANVDADARPVLRSLVRDHVARTGCALVIATSSPADAFALAQHAIILRGGSVVDRCAVRDAAASNDPYVRAMLAETTRPVS